MNDEELIELCREGEESAFEELIKKYHAPIYNYIYNFTGDKQLTEDIVQETFIKMINNILKYKRIRGTKFSTWLFTIARNTLNDEYRKMKTRRTVSLEEAELSIESKDFVETRVIQNDTMDSINQAINSLKKEEKSAIYLRYYMDLSYKDIADILKSTQNRVKWQLHDALIKIRKIIVSKEVNTDEVW